MGKILHAVALAIALFSGTTALASEDESYGVSVPENDAKELITLPASLAASFDAGWQVK